MADSVNTSHEVNLRVRNAYAAGSQTTPTEHIVSMRVQPLLVSFALPHSRMRALHIPSGEFKYWTHTTPDYTGEHSGFNPMDLSGIVFIETLLQ